MSRKVKKGDVMSVFAILLCLFSLYLSVNYLFAAYKHDKKIALPLLDVVRNFLLVVAVCVYIIVVHEKEDCCCSDSGGFFIITLFCFFYGAYFIFVSYILISLGLVVGFFDCTIQVTLPLLIFLIVSSVLFFGRIILCDRLFHHNWVKQKLLIWSMFIPDVCILYFPCLTW